MTARSARPLPEITPSNEHFWRGGKSGKLMFLRCKGCNTYVHPPAPVCPRCMGHDLAPEAVSGNAVVVASTVNHKAWVSGDDVPYALALVEMVEQTGLRLTTNVVGCPPDKVTIGLPVRVRFEQQDDVWIPLFEPASEPKA